MMDKSEDKNPLGNEDSLSGILQKRQEIDREIESRYTHKLTIMFTDIKGSTEYYERHGDLDGRIVYEKHSQIVDPIIHEHNGRIIKSTGDGALIVFNKPEDGVRAAIKIQNTIWKFNKDRQEGEQLHIKIAINHGKVIEDEKDVYGLAANITARIESVTEQDQILISQSVYDEVYDSKGIACEQIPQVRFKGVEQPLRLYKVRSKLEERTGVQVNRSAPRQSNLVDERVVFILDIINEEDKLKISGYEKIGDERKTVSQYEEVRVDDSKVQEHNGKIIELLNRVNPGGYVDKTIIRQLKSTGELLFDALFSAEIKQKLATTTAEDLVVSIDDHLVSIPWELLYDGDSFLCLRFNMGRLVRTRQTIPKFAVRQTKVPLEILIVADPQGNLPSAHKEGFSIRDKLKNLEDTIAVTIMNSGVNPALLGQQMCDFDILHYAGHADYDIKNPSNSGLLMEDGKLKASDINKLIGREPLPSLVFSNACQSGHTDAWKVGNDYEAQIYGLANAFLLAGVQHYIGTFWEVHDESSLYFATDFYTELAAGTGVGEAIRKARLELIKKYGEENIIWASYMLYGDPRFSYISNSNSEKEKDSKVDVQAIDGPLVRGRAKAAGDAFDSSRKNFTWRFVLFASVIVVLSAIGIFYSFNAGVDTPSRQIPIPVETESQEAKQKRIDDLVASLIKSYEENRGKQAVTDEWKSKPLTLVFLNIKATGATEIEKEIIISRVIASLQDSRRVQVVERAVLDKLLEELKLSTSELADPTSALTIGRILSAKLIATGSIVKDGKDWLINLRMIETETTSIKVALTQALETKEREEVAHRLSQEILTRLRSEYPLQGKVLSLQGQNITLDIGANEGVDVGQKFEVLSDTPGARTRLGELEVISIEKASSIGKLISWNSNLKEGLMIREL